MISATAFPRPFLPAPARCASLKRPRRPGFGGACATVSWAGSSFGDNTALAGLSWIFCCAAARLVIEINGDSHVDRVEYDLARTEWLHDRGYHVIRFTNRDVLHGMDAVLDAILQECRRRAVPSASLSGEGHGGG